MNMTEYQYLMSTLQAHKASQAALLAEAGRLLGNPRSEGLRQLASGAAAQAARNQGSLVQRWEEERRQKKEQKKSSGLGSSLGAVGGAALGSVLLPGVGTAAGAAIGGGVGGAAGEAAESAIVGAPMDPGRIAMSGGTGAISGATGGLGAGSLRVADTAITRAAGTGLRTAGRVGLGTAIAGGGGASLGEVAGGGLWSESKPEVQTETTPPRPPVAPQGAGPQAAPVKGQIQTRGGRRWVWNGTEWELMPEGA